MPDFRKLTVWQKARELTVATILACEEMSGTTATLRGQRRAAVLPAVSA